MAKKKTKRRKVMRERRSEPHPYYYFDAGGRLQDLKETLIKTFIEGGLEAVYDLGRQRDRD
jgi:hypothetical protein